MKKSQLRKIIRESIKSLMTEQQQTEPGTRYTLSTCSGQYHGIAQCIPDSFFGGSPVAVGHSFTMGYPPHPGNQGGIEDVYVISVVGSCVWYESSGNTFPTNMPTPAQIAPGPLNSCPNAPAAPLSCPGCNGGNHTWGNMQNWQNNFTTNMQNASWFNAPNQPCQFLNARIAQWESTQAGLSNCNAYHNALTCKIKYVDAILKPQYSC